MPGQDEGKEWYQPGPHVTELPTMALESENNLLPNSPGLLSANERLNEARELIDSGKAELKLVGRFSNVQHRDQILSALLVNPWIMPSSHYQNELPVQSTSAHNASSGSIIIDSPLTDTPGYYLKVDLVSKPVPNPNKAELEIKNLETARQRGLKVVEPVGALIDKTGEKPTAQVLTLLKKSVVPLSTIRLEGLRATPHHEQLRKLLEGVGSFIATLHNAGLSHGDLHPGNIGLDLAQQSSQEFVTYDLENSNILAEDKLRYKKNLQKATTESKQSFKQIEIKYLNDLTQFISFLYVFNSESVNEEFLKKSILDAYFRTRHIEQGQLSFDEFNEMFNTRYASYQRQADVARTKQQRFMAKYP